jgi:hypothetical protein
MEKDHLEIALEDIKGKFDLVLEGHDVLRQEIRETRRDLNEKIALVDFKVEVLNQKIDGFKTELDAKIDGVEARLSARIDGAESNLGARIDGVAANLTAHRLDTEAHPTLYKVKE